MWEVAGHESPWLRIGEMKPIKVLDEYDQPTIFTVVTETGDQLLAYQCGMDRGVIRYILVPIDDRIISDLERNLVTVREALSDRGWTWLVERTRAGISIPRAVNFLDLPPTALPKPGARLAKDTHVILRVRLTGKELNSHQIPASVVKRAVDGATGAIRVLAAHALEMSDRAGRPADHFRKYYDLPAVDIAFNSFEVAFAAPTVPDRMVFDETPTLERIGASLQKGLNWASVRPSEKLPEIFPLTPEWEAIVESLSKLTPPQKGVIEGVEVSGKLTGRYRPTFLDRGASERISAERKRFTPNTGSRIQQGFIRELDKDRRRFILRDKYATDLYSVQFGENQYDDVLLAFDTERAVTVHIYEAVAPHELISLSFGVGSPSPSTEPSP